MFVITGPWKGVCGAGRARRRPSVIVAEKIDVHVHAIGVFSKLARMVSKSSLSSEILIETVVLGASKRGKKCHFYGHQLT